MIELTECIICAFIGAGIAIIVQKTTLNRYFDLVECLWNQDLKRLNSRIDTLQSKLDKH